MTDKQKASKVLDFLGELGDAELVINILHPLISDEKLAGLYDDSLGFMIEEEEEFNANRKQS